MTETYDHDRDETLDKENHYYSYYDEQAVSPSGCRNRHGFVYLYIIYKSTLGDSV